MHNESMQANASDYLLRLFPSGHHQQRFYFTVIRRLIYNASQNSKTMEVRKKWMRSQWHDWTVRIAWSSTIVVLQNGAASAILFRTCCEMACTISDEWGTPTFNCYFRSLVISIRVPTAINQHSHTHTRMRRIYTRGINYRVLTEPTFVPFTYRRKHKIYACVRNECDVRMTRAGRRAHNSHQSDYATVSCFLFPVFFFGQYIVVGTHQIRKFR